MTQSKSKKKDTFIYQETFLLATLFFSVFAVPPPSVNESHYIVLSRNYWDSEWCESDLFVSSEKTHFLFHSTLGFLTRHLDLAAATWFARIVAWLSVALALRSIVRSLTQSPFACLAVAVIWLTGNQACNLSQEWMIGGVEAKVFAYACILAGIAQLIDANWIKCWHWLCLATAFHVLVGGWCLVACSVSSLILYRNEFFAKRNVLHLLIGLAISMIGLLPAVRASLSSCQGDFSVAAKIYCTVRLPHHLWPEVFSSKAYLTHFSLVTITFALLLLTRPGKDMKPIFTTYICVVAIPMIGLSIGLGGSFFPDISPRLLRLYWFRLSDSITPLFVALSVVASNAKRLIRLSTLVCLSALVVSFSTLSDFRVPSAVHGDTIDTRNWGRGTSHVYQNWLSLCFWTKASTPSDEVFITPRHQQTFKWYAERAEVVNWKDIPQDVDSIVKWRRRFVSVFPSKLGEDRQTMLYSDLKRLRREFGLRFIVIDHQISGRALPLVNVFKASFQKNSFDKNWLSHSVYRLP